MAAAESETQASQGMQRQELARLGRLLNGWQRRDEALGLAMERVRDMVAGGGRLPPFLAPLESVRSTEAAAPSHEAPERHTRTPSAAPERSSREPFAGDADAHQQDLLGSQLDEAPPTTRPRRGNGGEEPAWFTYTWSDYDESAAQAVVGGGFGLLLLFLVVALHVRTLAIALALAAVARTANATLTAQLAQPQPQRHVLLRNALAGVIPVLLVPLVVPFPWLHMLSFQARPVGETLWACFYLTAITDLLLVNSVIAFKSVAMCVLPWPVPPPRVTGFLVGTELLVQLYRQALPWPVWASYLIAFPSSLASAALASYSLMKLVVFILALAAAQSQMASAAIKGLGIGRPATAADIAAAGEVCAICQDDLSSPLCLDCSHVFCQACIATWLEKKQTCPVCRSLVPKAAVSKWSRGGTLLSMQAF